MALQDHSAPGAAAAFSFQFERALYWLAASSAGSIVGIETADDVAVITPNGQSLLEQAKHSIKPNVKTFADRSIDLWKTLSIWVEALHTTEIGADSHFFMTTNKLLPDCIARRISQASNSAEVDLCIGDLKEVASNPTEGIAEYTKYLLRDDVIGFLKQVILHCTLVDQADDTQSADLRKRTISHLQIPASCIDHAGSIADELLGWISTTALSQWQADQPAWISRNNFVNRFHAAISARRRRVERERSAHLIEIADEELGKQKGTTYVRQMHLITEDENDVTIAIRDFLKCNIEKNRLSVEGNVTDDDWLAFESSLVERWQHMRVRTMRMKAGSNEGDVGYEIFADTTSDFKAKLAGDDTEHRYLTSGSFHRLSDALSIGWHPRFSELLAETVEAET